MKVGDKKKAIVLGVVALVTVGVAVVRVIPRGVQVLRVGREAEAGDGAGGSRGPEGFASVGLLTAPFSHPMLAEREGADSSSRGEGWVSAGDGLRGGGSSVSGPLVFLPEEGDEWDRESEQAPGAEVVVGLQATVHAGGRVAILKIGGNTIRALEGSEVMEGWKVMEIRMSGVTLKGAGGERRLRVGEFVSLTAAPASEGQAEG